MADQTLTILYKFFGKREGQTLAEFARELRDLTTQDRIDLVSGIESGTLTY